MPRSKDGAKFGDEAGSTIENLNKMTKEERTRYWRNRAKYYEDFKANENWARNGCTSGIAVDRPRKQAVHEDGVIDIYET